MGHMYGTYDIGKGLLAIPSRLQSHGRPNDRDAGKRMNTETFVKCANLVDLQLSLPPP